MLLWFQSLTRDSNHSNLGRLPVMSAITREFQSLTRDSNHSNPSSARWWSKGRLFQSLTRDSNHSNSAGYWRDLIEKVGFNPSRGIAIIQTWHRPSPASDKEFQSLTRDSNHSNAAFPITRLAVIRVSIPHAG